MTQTPTPLPPPAEKEALMPTEIEQLRRRISRAEERAEGLKKEADQYREERDEWADSHRWLIENGWAWLGDLESLMEPEQRDGETLLETLDRLLAELKTLRAEKQQG